MVKSARATNRNAKPPSRLSSPKGGGVVTSATRDPQGISPDDDSIEHDGDSIECDGGPPRPGDNVEIWYADSSDQGGAWHAGRTEDMKGKWPDAKGDEDDNAPHHKAIVAWDSGGKSATISHTDMTKGLHGTVWVITDIGIESRDIDPTSSVGLAGHVIGKRVWWELNGRACTGTVTNFGFCEHKWSGGGKESAARLQPLADPKNAAGISTGRMHPGKKEAGQTKSEAWWARRALNEAEVKVRSGTWCRPVQVPRRDTRARRLSGVGLLKPDSADCILDGVPVTVVQHHHPNRLQTRRDHGVVNAHDDGAVPCGNPECSPHDAKLHNTEDKGCSSNSAPHAILFQDGSIGIAASATSKCND